MSWTIAVWLGTWPVVAFAAISIIGAVFLACTSIFSLLVSYGFLPTTARPWFPMGFSTAWALTTNLTILLFTILVVLDTSLRFDRIAGRMAGGTVATTVDAMVHGTARKAVFLPDEKPARKIEKVAVLPVEEKLAAPSA
jgi:hypothetical protein